MVMGIEALGKTLQHNWRVYSEAILDVREERCRFLGRQIKKLVQRQIVVLYVSGMFFLVMWEHYVPM